MMNESYLQRCLQLAQLGAGNVAPNPLVGAVLVFEDRMIGEGWHQQFGGPHAEVNCFNSVQPADRKLVPFSTLYVSLEPCAHFGKTPPCADLILREKVKTVVIGCRDPFPAVDGKGIERLEKNGVRVILAENELKAACIDINRRFFTFHQQHRPYIILKWAQTADGYIGSGIEGERLLISNSFTNRLVHRWRSEEAAILVGTETALLDNPALTNRWWPGPTPVRIALDRQLRIPGTHQLLNGQVPTIIFTTKEKQDRVNLRYVQLDEKPDLLPALLTSLYKMGIQSVLVEGGSRLLQSFIDASWWDEARIITQTELQTGKGVAAPVLRNQYKTGSTTLLTDRIDYFKPGQRDF